QRRGAAAPRGLALPTGRRLVCGARGGVTRDRADGPGRRADAPPPDDRGEIARGAVAMPDSAAPDPDDAAGGAARAPRRVRIGRHHAGREPARRRRPRRDGPPLGRRLAPGTRAARALRVRRALRGWTVASGEGRPGEATTNTVRFAAAPDRVAHFIEIAGYNLGGGSEGIGP